MSKGCSRFWVFRGIPSRVGHRCLFAGEKKWRVCFGRGEVPKVPIRESVRVSHPAMMITILQRKGFCSDWVFAAFDRCLLHFACLLCNGEDDGVIASMTPPSPMPAGPPFRAAQRFARWLPRPPGKGRTPNALLRTSQWRSPETTPRPPPGTGWRCATGRFRLKEQCEIQIERSVFLKNHMPNFHKFSDS